MDGNTEYQETAADEARDIHDTAKIDITQLATRTDGIKAVEAKKPTETHAVRMSLVQRAEVVGVVCLAG